MPVPCPRLSFPSLLPRDRSPLSSPPSAGVKDVRTVHKIPPLPPPLLSGLDSSPCSQLSSRTLNGPQLGTVALAVPPRGLLAEPGAPGELVSPSPWPPLEGFAWPVVAPAERADVGPSLLALALGAKGPTGLGGQQVPCWEVSRGLGDPSPGGHPSFAHPHSLWPGPDGPSPSLSGLPLWGDRALCSGRFQNTQNMQLYRSLWLRLAVRHWKGSVFSKRVGTSSHTGGEGGPAVGQRAALPPQTVQCGRPGLSLLPRARLEAGGGGCGQCSSRCGFRGPSWVSAAGAAC